MTYTYNTVNTLNSQYIFFSKSNSYIALKSQDTDWTSENESLNLQK